VILVDANLLVYAHVDNFPQHARARAWFDTQFTSGIGVGLPWASLTAFLRLVTNPRMFDSPEPMDEAWRQVEEWLDRDGAWVPVPTRRHRTVLTTVLTGTSVRGDLVPDAHLAALAIEHGLTVASTDGDFGRFPGVRWTNPLTPPIA
jgi:toxin-antitoxin system PIN domain toxin